MTATDKYLKPHGIFENRTFDEHCSRIPEFYFKKEVPEDVVKNFEIVEQLLAHSYYEYRFIDEALAKALHTFEMAMRIRYNEVVTEPKKRVVFNDLITELSNLNLFEASFETLKHVKSLRNYYSHPERHSFGGVFHWNKIEFINRLINEMYEDINLRLERTEKAKGFIEEQQKKNLHKSLIIYVDGDTHLLYSLELLFVNNKHNPNAYLLACVPLFNLEEIDGAIITPPIIDIKVCNPSFSDDTLICESFTSKQKIKFSPINSNPQLLPEFEAWNHEYSNKTPHSKFLYERSNIHIGEILVPEIEEFQRM